MGTLVVAVVALTYAFYSTRGRANALIGAGLLIPYSQLIPSGSVPILNVQSLIMILVGGSLLIGALARTQGRAVRPNAPASIGVFLVVVVLSYLHTFFAKVPEPYSESYDPWDNFLSFKDCVAVLFLAYAAHVLSTDEKTMRRIFWGCVAGWSGETAFCLLELLVKGGRVTGHFVNANATGSFLATFSAVSLGVYLALRGDTRRWIFAALGIAGAAATMGTRSRGAFLALGVTFLLVSFVKSRLVFAFLILLALSYSYWLPAPLMNRLEQAVAISDKGDIEAADTAASRIEIWKAGLRTIPDHPFGLGFGLYPYFVGQYGLEGTLTHVRRNAHNDLVLVTVEMGIAGLLAFLAMIFSLARRAWTAARRDENAVSRAVGFGAFAGLLAVLAAGLSGNDLLVLNRTGVLWILLGVASRRAGEIYARREESRRERRTVEMARA